MLEDRAARGFDMKYADESYMGINITSAMDFFGSPLGRRSGSNSGTISRILRGTYSVIDCARDTRSMMIAPTSCSSLSLLNRLY